MELSSIDNLFKEIDYLKNKAVLLDAILEYWDTEEMTFNIPDKWRNVNSIGSEKRNKIPKSPRHFINKEISKLLPYSESERKVNWDRLGDTLAD